MSEQLTYLTLVYGEYPEGPVDRLGWLIQSELVPERGPLHLDPLGQWLIARMNLGDWDAVTLLSWLTPELLCEYLEHR